MRIVVDTNIIISALIKDSTTRSILLLSPHEFFTPDYLFEEIEEHRIEIIKKSSLREEEFDQLLSALLFRIELIHSSTLLNYRNEAIEIAKQTDIEDAVFFACSLSIPGSMIWSEDKDFKKQNKIGVLTTKDLI